MVWNSSSPITGEKEYQDLMKLTRGVKISFFNKVVNLADNEFI